MRNFTDLMVGNKQLCKLLNNSRHFQKIESLLFEVLPVNFVTHIELQSYEQGILVLTASNSNWAGKLRFFLPQISRDLKKYFYFKELKDIKIKIITEHTNQNKLNIVQKKPFPASVKKSLLETANSIEDPELSAALKKLAQH